LRDRASRLSSGSETSRQSSPARRVGANDGLGLDIETTSATPGEQDILPKIDQGNVVWTGGGASGDVMLNETASRRAGQAAGEELLTTATRCCYDTSAAQDEALPTEVSLPRRLRECVIVPLGEKRALRYWLERAGIDRLRASDEWIAPPF
jgi:hypothetical protein